MSAETLSELTLSAARALPVRSLRSRAGKMSCSVPSLVLKNEQRASQGVLSNRGRANESRGKKTKSKNKKTTKKNSKTKQKGKDKKRTETKRKARSTTER